MLALRPGAASSYIGLALARARLKDFDAAVADTQAGAGTDPDSEILMTRLGYTYLVMSRSPTPGRDEQKCSRSIPARWTP